MKLSALLIAIMAALAVMSCSTPTVEDWNAQAIQPWAENPRYWQYKGKPVLLAGGSKTDHLFLADSLLEHLDEMAAIGGNYVRNTMSQRGPVELKPHKLLPDGTFDLDQWNEEYWQRFQNFLQWTSERDIIVQIEVWDRFDYSMDSWEISPWRPSMNITYTSEISGLADEYPEQAYRDKQPFFHSVPGMPLYDPRLDMVRRHQENFVDKMLSYSLHYGNVLYCMDNETNTPPEWGRYWMDWIRTKAREKNRVVYTTDMFDEFYKPQECMSCLNALQDAQAYTFLEISQNNSRNFDQAHWDMLQWILQERDKFPLRPANNTKIYGGGNSSWGSGSNADGVERFCRNIVGGCASVRHHRQNSGNGLNDRAKASIKAVRAVERYVKFWYLKPAMELLGEREPDEAYVTAYPGGSYVLYFTDGGEVTLNLSEYAGNFTARWISVADGEEKGSFKLRGGGPVPVQAPAPDGWFAVIIQQ